MQCITNSAPVQLAKTYPVRTTTLIVFITAIAIAAIYVGLNAHTHSFFLSKPGYLTMGGMALVTLIALFWIFGPALKCPAKKENAPHEELEKNTPPSNVSNSKEEVNLNEKDEAKKVEVAPFISGPNLNLYEKEEAHKEKTTNFADEIETLRTTQTEFKAEPSQSEEDIKGINLSEKSQETSADLSRYFQTVKLEQLPMAKIGDFAFQDLKGEKLKLMTIKNGEGANLKVIVVRFLSKSNEKFYCLLTDGKYPSRVPFTGDQISAMLRYYQAIVKAENKTYEGFCLAGGLTEVLRKKTGVILFTKPGEKKFYVVNQKGLMVEFPLDKLVEFLLAAKVLKTKEKD